MNARSKRKVWPIRGYLPKLYDEQAEPVESPQEAAKVRQRHFSRVEAAVIMDGQDLMQRHESQ
eukprot:5386976-Karenia_brevis.AAC.1